MEFHSVKLFREAIGVTAKNVKLLLCSSIFLPVAAEIWEHLSAEKYLSLFALTHNCCNWHDLNWKHKFIDNFSRLGWPWRPCNSLSGLMFGHWSIHNSSKCNMSLVNETSLRHFKKLMSNSLKLIHCPIPFAIYSRLVSFLSNSCVLLIPWNVLHVE